MKSDIGKQISVCLLTYNHSHLLQSTIESILQQSITDYEIIVSDDCSTDDTWELLENLQSADKRIKAIRTSQNVGMAKNANFAISKSSRPYIALLHHDDIYCYKLLEKWAEVLEHYQDVGFVFNQYGGEGHQPARDERLPAGEVDGRWLLKRFLFPRWGCVVRGTAMIRRTTWERVGGMRAQYGLLADVDLWMRLSMVSTVGYVPEKLVIVRSHRPENYPREYLSQQEWSWVRQRILYEIHAQNRLEYFNLRTLGGRLNWWLFRVRLSLETLRWLVYAIVRKKSYMIHDSIHSASPYDVWPLDLIRTLLRSIYRHHRL